MSDRRGLTLVELLVALAVASGLLVLAHDAVSDAAFAARQLGEERLRADREANGRRLAARLIGNLTIDGRYSGAVIGASERVSFTTWTTSPAGEWTLTHAALGHADNGALLLVVGLDSLELAGSLDAVAIDYLGAWGANSPWLREWSSQLTAPLAIRLRVTSPGAKPDTILFLVGPRG